MGKLLTDAEIRKALRDIERTDKTAITLTDAAPRGSGRLALIVRRDRSEWYAVRYLDGARKLTKLGNFPALNLAQARAKFGLGSAPVITGDATLSQLFDAYVEKLESRGKPSAKDAKRVLADCAITLGGSRLIKSITPTDVVRVLKPIHDRNAPAHADQYRVFMCAAFNWALKSANDYTANRPREWGIAINPVALVPHDPNSKRVGNRWLSKDEFFALAEWLQTNSRLNPKTADAILLLMFTGCRMKEITDLKTENWNRGERLITLEKTKNGRPHILPLCNQAADIINKCSINEFQRYFANERDLSRRMGDATIRNALVRYCASNSVKPINCRDLRRTWKTLAGDAGISKTDRDLMQNHSRSDVSSRHYDRYEYLSEKRAAAEKWSIWLEKGGIRAPSDFMKRREP